VHSYRLSCWVDVAVAIYYVSMSTSISMSMPRFARHLAMTLIQALASSL
jgi:hypothetical protein